MNKDFLKDLRLPQNFSDTCRKDFLTLIASASRPQAAYLFEEAAEQGEAVADLLVQARDSDGPIIIQLNVRLRLLAGNKLSNIFYMVATPNIARA